MRPCGRNYAAARRLPRGAPDRPPRGPATGGTGVADGCEHAGPGCLAPATHRRDHGGGRRADRRRPDLRRRVAGRAGRLALLRHHRHRAARHRLAAAAPPGSGVLALCADPGRHHDLGARGGRVQLLAAGAAWRRARPARDLAAAALDLRRGPPAPRRRGIWTGRLARARRDRARGRARNVA